MWQQLANTRITIKLRSLEIQGALAMPVKPEWTRIMQESGRPDSGYNYHDKYNRKNLHEQMINN